MGAAEDCEPQPALVAFSHEEEEFNQFVRTMPNQVYNTPVTNLSTSPYTGASRTPTKVGINLE